jgi:anti-sigma regulatory factor (Ser/Thr protein kinase)
VAFDRESDETVYAADTDYMRTRKLVRHRWVNLAETAEPSALARDQVRRTLAGQVPARCIDDAVLVASELVGNALRHTSGGPDCMFIEVYADIAVLWVHDADTDDGSVKVRTVDEVLNELPEGGLGLRLVEELTAEWFVRPTAIGKAVIAVLNLDDVGAT